MLALVDGSALRRRGHGPEGLGRRAGAQSKESIDDGDMGEVVEETRGRVCGCAWQQTGEKDGERYHRVAESEHGEDDEDGDMM